jgi:hypothetical protein
MELEPVIASFSGEAYRAIHKFLDQEALQTVTRVAESPLAREALDPEHLRELVEMHVLVEREGLVRLDTAVFSEEDILEVNQAASKFGQELAGRVSQAARALQYEHPALVNFLVGIVGIGQSLHQSLKESGSVVDWKGYTGRYAHSKVDFDEVCPARTALGPDLQNKHIFKGREYTAVFIGPGSSGYLRHSKPGESPGAILQMNRFLTDAFAALLAERSKLDALRVTAEQFGLLQDGVPATVVVTQEVMDAHRDTVEKVAQTAQELYIGGLPWMFKLLRATTGGKQGVPPENMMMHLWRYMRRAIARELYACGFFLDQAPETGLLTVFYENKVGYLKEMFV